MPALHITNGAAIAESLRGAGADAVVSWDDILYEGPVPARQDDATLRWTRAKFLARAGWADQQIAWQELMDRDAAMEKVDASTTVVLWFDTCLSDQLQSLQVLDRLARRGRIRDPIRVVDPTALTFGLQPSRVRPLHRAASPLEHGTLDRAASAWAAFRSPSPFALTPFSTGPTAGLPHLRPAIQRLVQEYPWTTDGLSRSDRDILGAAANEETLADAFKRISDLEDTAFMGDLVFEWRVRRLMSGDTPLVEVDRGGWGGTLSLTPAGAAIVGGLRSALEIVRIDRWIGGARLLGAPPALYDPTADSLVAP
ncbi:MAG: DUF1835 domain-containing protein [Bacteroidota bacterium]